MSVRKTLGTRIARRWTLQMPRMITVIVPSLDGVSPVKR